MTTVCSVQEKSIIMDKIKEILIKIKSKIKKLHNVISEERKFQGELSIRK